MVRAVIKVSVSSIKGRSRLNWASKEVETSRFLSLLKAYLYIVLK
jgi:hypothetical protein